MAKDNEKSNNLNKAIIVVIIVVVTMVLLYFEGRSLICTCERVFIWVGDIWSSDTSQHLFDPYSFTHLLHGFLFSWFLLLLTSKVKENWKLTITVIIESFWEVLENSNFIINKYRADTIAKGYQGDTIINSISDIICCIIGFFIAQYLGFRKSLIIFILIEIILLISIRDSLVLNIIMLLFPIEHIKRWQMGE